MARNIIIMDSSASMRRIIRTRIQVTVSDAVISEAVDAKEAMELIEDARYHLVLFSKESSSEKWLEFAQNRLCLPEKQRTNFILFTSRQNKAFFDEIKHYGIEEHIVIPCPPNELGALIAKVCAPFAMRGAKRYSIPGSTALLEQGAGSYPAEILNFSEGGLLCDLAAPAQLNWTMPMMISLELKIPKASKKVVGLYSVIRRLQVVDTNPDYSPKTIRLACRYITVPDEGKKQLSAAFRLLDKQEEE